MSRHRRSRDGDGVLLLLLGAGIVWVVVAVGRFVADNWIPFTAAAIVVGGIVITIAAIQRRNRRQATGEEAARRLEYQRQLEARLSSVRISDSRADYLISNDDYRRGTLRENFYRKTFLLPLLSAFGNRCANCGTTENGVDIDHFVFSKNEGGSFAMLHRDGFWINNAIPLCETCNRSKLDRSYRDFFTPERLLDILERNVEMTKRINAAEVMGRFRPTVEDHRHVPTLKS